MHRSERVLRVRSASYMRTQCLRSISAGCSFPWLWSKVARLHMHVPVYTWLSPNKVMCRPRAARASASANRGSPISCNATASCMARARGGWTECVCVRAMGAVRASGCGCVHTSLWQSATSCEPSPWRLRLRSSDRRRVGTTSAPSPAPARARASMSFTDSAASHRSPWHDVWILRARRSMGTARAG